MKRSRTFQFFTCGMLTYLALFTGLQPSLQAQALSVPQGAPVSDLTIKILEGEDGVNIIQKKSAVKPVVQVVDKNNLPVAGATVVFALPSSGASATFAG